MRCLQIPFGPFERGERLHFGGDTFWRFIGGEIKEMRDGDKT